MQGNLVVDAKAKDYDQQYPDLNAKKPKKKKKDHEQKVENLPVVQEHLKAKELDDRRDERELNLHTEIIDTDDLLEDGTSTVIALAAKIAAHKEELFTWGEVSYPGSWVPLRTAGTKEISHNMLSGACKDFERKQAGLLKELDQITVKAEGILKETKETYRTTEERFTKMQGVEGKRAEEMAVTSSDKIETSKKEALETLIALDKTRCVLTAHLTWINHRKGEVTSKFKEIKGNLLEKQIDANISLEDYSDGVIGKLKVLLEEVVSLKEKVKLANEANGSIQKRDKYTFRAELREFSESFEIVKSEFYKIEKEKVAITEFLTKAYDDAPKDAYSQKEIDAMLAADESLTLESIKANEKSVVHKRQMTDTTRTLVAKFYEHTCTRFNELTVELNKLHYADKGKRGIFVSPTKEPQVESKKEDTDYDSESD